MVELDRLLAALRDGESTTVEFKSVLPKNAWDVAQVIAAFANTGGGLLIVGVDDTGRVVGDPDPDQTMQRLAGIVRASCVPAPIASIDRVRISDKEIVCAEVSNSATLILVDGKTYIRVGSTVQAVRDAAELARLIHGGNVAQPRARIAQGRSIATPSPVRSFSGRADELRRVIALAGDEDIGLISIEGISGIGKTALARQAVAGLLDEGVDVFWLDCHPRVSFDSFTLELARHLRASGDEIASATVESVGDSVERRIAALVDVVGGRLCSLFFDDYHLISDPALDACLTKLAKTSTLATIVLTSRQRPPLLGRVGPGRSREEYLGTGLDLGSCRLFLAACGLGLSDRQAEAVWKLTGAGHPKALELLAVRARSQPLNRLLESLPVFHEKLREEWLAPILDELHQDERLFAMEFAIFDQPISSAVLSKAFADKSMDGIVLALIDRFILDYTHSGLLQMHSLIRDVCYSLLPDKRARHLWAAQLFQREGEPTPGNEVDLLPDDQIDALLTSWGHYLAAEEHGRAIEIVDLLRRPLMNKGHYEQMVLLLEQTPIESEEKADWFALERARILGFWGSTSEALDLVTVLVKSPNQALAREAVLVCASILNESGRPARAKQVLEEHLELVVGQGSPAAKTRFLTRFVQACLLMGDPETARDWASRILEGCESRGDRIGGGIALRQLAASLQAKGNLKEAAEMATLSATLLREESRMREMAMSEKTLGTILRDADDPEAAKRAFLSALATFIDLGDRRNAELCRRELGLQGPPDLQHSEER